MWARTTTHAFAAAVTTPSDATIRAEILAQVTKRGAGKTICPSEVARALSDDWRALMPAVREAAQGLAGQGKIAVTQKGRLVNAIDAKGPIRLGIPHHSD